jgi:stringent starvation protein B
VSNELELPNKRDVVRALLLKGSVFVHLDPRREGVSVPQWLRTHTQLVLQVGFDMPVPIHDLHIDEQGVFATLSFNRSPFSCRVPWEAVFALVGDDGRGMVWPESMPPEIAAEVDREAKRRKSPDEPTLAPAASWDRSHGAEDSVGATVSMLGAPPSRGAPASHVDARRSARAKAAPSFAKLDGLAAGGGSPTPITSGAERGSHAARESKARKAVKLPPYLRVVK